MRICLSLDPSQLLRWHLWLAEALAEVPGNEVSCALAAGHRPQPISTFSNARRSVICITLIGQQL
jgi:hypothetical protein